MAKSWLRLWHDFPYHGSFRIVAEKAGQSIALTQAVYIQLLVRASEARDSGYAAGFDSEVAAYSLGVATSDVEAILDAMQGRLLDDSRIIDWHSRQAVGGSRPSAECWAQLRAEVFERDDYTCRYCGERGGRLECDHVIPVSRGGSNELDNLVTACFKCNRSKRSKTVREWLSIDTELIF